MEIIAHRGASARAPENTLAAFRLAWAMQADGIEMDVHLSRDGRMMVHHDADTHRCAGMMHRIAATDSAMLRTLDVGRWKALEYAGELMPFLEEVLATVPPGRRVLIEVKSGPDTVPALGRVLAAVDCTAMRLALISFRLDTLDACRAALPAIPAYYVVEANEADDRVLPFGAELIAVARRHDLAGLDPEHRGIDVAFAAAVRAAGLELLTWTVNDPERLGALAAMGVGAVTTDRPEAMRRVLDDAAADLSAG